MGLPCDGSCRCSSPTWRGWRLWPWAPRSSLRTLEPFQRRRSGGGWRSASASAGVLGGTASLDAVASGKDARAGRAFEGRASWDQSQRANSRSRAGIYKQRRPHQLQTGDTFRENIQSLQRRLTEPNQGPRTHPSKRTFHPPAFRGGATTDISQSAPPRRLRTRHPLGISRHQRCGSILYLIT